MASTPPPNAFTKAQLEAFYAAADTYIPGLNPEQLLEFRAELEKQLPQKSEEEWTEILEFASKSATESEGFKENVHLLEKHLAPHKFKEFQGLLDLLGSHIGSLMLCRSWTPFHLRSLEHRTEALLSWKTSSLALFNKAYKGITLMTRYCYAQTATANKGFGMPLVDPELNSERYTSKEFHTYKFEELPDELSADIVIIGTGAGGGVAAKNISEWARSQGLKLDILVLEKGEYIHQSEMTMTEEQAIRRLFEKALLTPNEDATLTLAAGSTFGGGTTVNWSVSLRTPGLVRREWAEEFGLNWFVSKEFGDSLDRVENRMGVSTKAVEHNKINKLMQEGATQLGYAIHEIPQNTAGAPHKCGYCSNGCRFGEKQGTAVTFLVDASNAGVKFAQNVEVRKILFESRGKAKQVVGLDCLVGLQFSDSPRRKVKINTTKVILSGGSINSPALLLRSGLTNPQIGDNLRCHPSSFLHSYMPANFPHLEPHIGPIASNVINELSALSEPPYVGYGARIETPNMMPVTGTSQIPWFSGPLYKNLMVRHSHCLPLYSMARDGRREAIADGVYTGGTRAPEPHPGKITISKETGAPMIHYVLTKEDRASIVEGLVLAAEVAITAGATELYTSCLHGSPYVVPPGSVGLGTATPGFREWCAELRRLGNQPDQLGLASGHQMGTCRMSAESWERSVGLPEEKPVPGNAKPGVVDHEGRVFGVHGLWVCDGSVLPGAPGVNPMVTIMSTADGISRKICERWQSSGGFRSKH